jgi:hypothetical protein
LLDIDACGRVLFCFIKGVCFRDRAVWKILLFGSRNGGIHPGWRKLVDLGLGIPRGDLDRHSQPHDPEDMDSMIPGSP